METYITNENLHYYIKFILLYDKIRNIYHISFDKTLEN